MTFSIAWNRCRRAAVALLATCVVTGIALADPAMDATVLIFSPDGEPKGAGVLVNPDGVILTARHVIADLIVEKADDVTGLSYYPLMTTVRRQTADSKASARLIAVHPYMDVAALKAEFPAQVPALKIAASRLERNAQVVLTGHRLPVQSRVLFNQTGAHVKDLDRGGLIVVNTNVPQGYSGGPLVKDGELFGLIRSVDPVKVETFVIPVTAFAQALAAMDVGLAPGGYATRTSELVHQMAGQFQRLSSQLSDVTAKMDRLQDLYVQSQTDVSWVARLHVKQPISGDELEELTLELSYEKARSTQPELVGAISASVEPIYDDEDYKRWRSEHPGVGHLRIEGTFDEQRPKVTKPEIQRGLSSMAQLHYGNLDLPLEKLRGFQIQANVRFVTADNSVREPLERSICFALVPDAYESGELTSMSERGERCLIGD